jgi:protein arginine N-methyltransferase 1
MPAVSGIEAEGDEAAKVDFQNYFVSYGASAATRSPRTARAEPSRPSRLSGYLYHQKDMLQDRGRMDAYRNSILRNAMCFKDKVVLDVGTGSGVLAMWAAMAGAKRVYAVEATSMAQHARRLVQQNGLSSVVTVLEGYMEKQTLPEKVDVILSEWMGYFLLRESMVDSVIAARDLWLKPGGAMYPSHAVLRMAPLCSNLYANRLAELESEMGSWSHFGEWMSQGNGVNVAGLTEFFVREQQEYLLQASAYVQLNNDEVLGPTFDILEMNLSSCSVADIATIDCPFRTAIEVEGQFNAFGGWFDTDFNGSADEPTPNPVTLTTRPESTTHWAQQVFLVHPAPQVQAGDVIEGVVKLARQKVNHRLLWLQMVFTHLRPGVGQIGEERTMNWRID